MPETAILDHTMQLDKIHAGRDGDVKRHKPSRDHIQRLSRGLDPDQQAEVLNVHYIGPLHSQKRASCSKSPISKPISECVRIACSGLMIKSLLQVVNRLAASCELHSGLTKVVSSTCSKSANIKLQQV